MGQGAAIIAEQDRRQAPFEAELSQSRLLLVRACRMPPLPVRTESHVQLGRIDQRVFDEQ